MNITNWKATMDRRSRPQPRQAQASRRFLPFVGGGTKAGEVFLSA